MRIQVVFHLKGEQEPIAWTGVDGGVSDMLLPFPGDLVVHRGKNGSPITGRVVERAFSYDVADGIGVSGTITVTIFLEPVTLH